MYNWVVYGDFSQDDCYISRAETWKDYDWPKRLSQLIPCKGRHSTSLFLFLSVFFFCWRKNEECLVLCCMNQFWRFGPLFHVSDRVIKWPAKTDRIEVNLFPFCVMRAIWVILTSMEMFQSQAWRGGRASSARWLHVRNIVRGGQQIQKRPRHTGRR